MADTITHLRGDDYDQHIAFLDAAFAKNSERSFARILPALYQPTDPSMATQLVIQRDGQTAACVGLFPITWHLGARTLRIAGIGGVSVAQAFRGQGLMRQLMIHAAQRAIDDGYDLSYLGGQRQRYAYFGWESAGVLLDFHLTRDNIRHTLGDQQPCALTLRPFAADDEAAVAALHRRSFSRCDRPRLADTLGHWLHRPVVGVRADGAIAAYAVLANEGQRVVELVAEDDAAGLAMCCALLSGEHRALDIQHDAFPRPWPRRLAALAESQRIAPSGNWRIFDWPATLGALLQACCDLTPMAEGRVVLEIDGQCYALRVEGGLADCQRCDGPAEVSGDGLAMTRLLFGPLRPSLVRPVSQASAAAASLLEAWCPLPLSIPHQDHV